MFTIFQTETGGSITFPSVSVPTASSGYVDVIAQDRALYRFDGEVVSGYLSISRSGLATLPPDQYVLLPQVVDPDTRVYFLATDDLQIMEVPSFFESVLLTPGNSVLVRLNNVEALMSLLLGAPFDQNGVVQMAPSGLAGGDLGASYPNPSVVGLYGVPISPTMPANGAALVYNASEWQSSVIVPDAYYRHVQDTPAAVWTIVHNLSKKPAVDTFTTDGSRVVGSVIHINDFVSEVTFSTPTSGEAMCN